MTSVRSSSAAAWACHTQSAPQPPGNLVLDDTALYGGLPVTTSAWPTDSAADWGYPPVISNGIWRQTNASRLRAPLQSRRSLLLWKIFGRRLDGWTNADHPTESVPGDASTLPAGASANDADLDFTGQRHAAARRAGAAAERGGEDPLRTLDRPRLPDQQRAGVGERCLRLVPRRPAGRP